MEIKLHDICGEDAVRVRDGVLYATQLLGKDASRIHQVSVEWENQDEDKVLISVTWVVGGFSEDARHRLDDGFMERFNRHAEVHVDKSGNELI